MQYISVRAVASALKDQFGVEMDIFQVITSCRDALKKMGALALSRSIYVACVKDFKVMLPSTVWKVRGVIRLDGMASYSGTIILQDGIDFPPQIIFTQPEVTITETPLLLKSNYVPSLTGPWIDYVWTLPRLDFNETNIPVAVEVTSLMLDEEKFPMLPEQSYFGCLNYALFVYYQPLFLRGQVSKVIFDEIKDWKRMNMAQSEFAMGMEALTGNERDKLFDIMTSFDRKRFGVPV